MPDSKLSTSVWSSFKLRGFITIDYTILTISDKNEGYTCQKNTIITLVRQHAIVCKMAYTCRAILADIYWLHNVSNVQLLNNLVNVHACISRLIVVNLLSIEDLNYIILLVA